MDNVVFAKYNRTRAPQFQTKTTIVEEDGRRFVIKEALCPEAEAHVRSMKDKQEMMEAVYNEVCVAACRIKDDKAYFPYVEGDTIGTLLLHHMDSKEELLEKVSMYLKRIMSFKETEPFVLTDGFEKVFGAFHYEGEAVSKGNIDAIFDNFLIKDNQVFLIDYEWVFDFAIPLEYIEFRTLFYFYAKNGNYLKNVIDLTDFLAYFGIDDTKKELYLSLDDHFQQYAHGENRKYIYTSNYYQELHSVTKLITNTNNIELDIIKKDQSIAELSQKAEALEQARLVLQQVGQQLDAVKDQVAAKEQDIIHLHEVLHEKEELILMKDKNISDFQENEVVLNNIIKSQRNDIAIQLDQIQNKDAYIAFLQHCMRNPFFALGQGVKKVAKRVLPDIVQMGLYCLATEGVGVFCYKSKLFLQGKNQYKTWIQNNENDIYKTETLSYNPMISVVVPVYNVETGMLIECIESVRKQTYKNWQLCLVDDCSTMESVRATLKKYENKERVKIAYREENGHISKATNTGIALADGEFVALLDCDDLLAPNALYEMVKMLNQNPKYDFIYSDEDKVTEDGKIRKDPFFKPDWSPDTFMSIMYTCHFSMFRKSLVDELGGMRVGYEGSQDYDLVLRVMERTRRIGHVPRILYHWRERKESTANSMTAKPYIIESTKKAKTDALSRRGLAGHLECIDSITQFRVVYEPMNNPKVSIIIPSKDNVKLLTQCISSIREYTDYTHYEVIVVDNGSSEENRQAYAALCEGENFHYYYEPMEFNFSRMCNIGAGKATGDYVLFLNDDIQIQGHNWLSVLLGQAQVPYAGAVGCKLLYPGGIQIQHVGVLNLEIGPGHAFHGFDDNMNYYYGRNILDYNFCVVTGACLLVKKEKFDMVHGFDETLPVAYNDVELCFKLIEAGYYNVLRNDVVLVHHESVSRGYDEMTQEKALRRKREMEHLYELHPDFRNYDPCYNPNLVQTRGDFSFNLERGGTLQEVSQRSGSPKVTDGITYNIDDVNNGATVKIAGWAFLKDSQKAGTVSVVLAGSNGKCYEMKSEASYRPDVKASFANRKKLAFAGFVSMFAKDEIAKGEYDIYLSLRNEVVKTDCRLLV